jgi:Neurotransmitter-gated ion-channel ligand binding domain/Neurotransmitter-gated ion-channel transmembrane region
MSKKFCSALVVSILVRSIQVASSAEMPPLIDRPNADSGPTQISVGIWVADISNIDSAQQTFTAEIAVVLRWKDPRLAHTGNGVVRYPREQIWHPRVGIVNETNSVSRKMPDSVEVEPDGTVTYRQLYVGAFTQPLRLHSFPFDRQTFRVQLVAVRYQSNEVMFVPDQVWIRDGLKEAGGISPSVTLPDWTIEKWELKPLVYALAPRHQYSSYAFEFTASRNVQYYILKVILPLVLIVMMSWSVFWIDPVHSNSQISIAVTSMLTLIAYRFAVDSQLPRLPYMTRLDAFILTSTLLVFFSLIEVLITTILETSRRTGRAKKIDRYCRAIFPAMFLIASIAIFVHPRG